MTDLLLTAQIAGIGRDPHPDESKVAARMLDKLNQGKEAYARQAWNDAYRALSLADRASTLGGGDLEQLATAAYLTGRDEEFLSALERAHRVYLDAGESVRAVRCAFWVCLQCVFRGETARASGWLARAQRLIERQNLDCAERGYLMLPMVEQQIATGESETAYANASAAVEIGERFGDADLIACARHLQGRILIQEGNVQKGLAMLDETMLTVIAGELSPIVTGLLYCSVIDGCKEIYELRRAREWTAALTQWCERQPDMVAFTGRCMVHRAEIMQLHGAWNEALEEVQRARRRCQPGSRQTVAGQAAYRHGEIHRLQGRFAAAEEAYGEASQCGCEPQPGLALLRLAQGRKDAAMAAIRRAVDEATDPLKRARLLPACVEIMLTVGDLQKARYTARELEETSNRWPTIRMLDAMAAHSRGAVELADGDARAALAALRHAGESWQALEAPHEAACVRVLVASACRALGDSDTAALELAAARGTFEQLGAAPDLVRVDAIARGKANDSTHGLTTRELQVLRLLSTGKSNREIAAGLTISERTVARHVQNIFGKLGVTSRTAASAFAFRHNLM